MTHQQQTAFENIVGKGEIARNEQFLLPTIFSNQSDNCIPICPHYLLLNWKNLKLADQVNGYVHKINESCRSVKIHVQYKRNDVELITRGILGSIKVKPFSYDRLNMGQKVNFHLEKI